MHGSLSFQNIILCSPRQCTLSKVSMHSAARDRFGGGGGGGGLMVAGEGEGAGGLRGGAGGGGGVGGLRGGGGGRKGLGARPCQGSPEMTECKGGFYG